MGINLTSAERDALTLGLQQGHEDAARYLEGTAADYEQMERRQAEAETAKGFGLSASRDQRRALKEKAQLLRAQAAHIRALPV